MTAVQSRIATLITDFPRFLEAFQRQVPFSRPWQLEYHLKTIRRRREIGSAASAINDDDFIHSLYKTLQAWGIGVRGSILKPLDAFSVALREKTSEIVALENAFIDAPSLNVKKIGNQLWHLIDTLNIVENSTPIVSGSKALHHILPDLVVPMDRAYTQKFFRWQNPKFQYGQALCFEEAFVAFAQIARATNPSQYVNNGWNSSTSKVIDNAIVGFVSKTEMSKQPATVR